MRNFISRGGTAPFAAAVVFFVILLFHPAGASSGGSFTLDPESASCVGCHGAEADPASGAPGHPGRTSHPVGMDYAAAAARDRSLAPPADLDPRLVLADGRVGCATCHLPYSKASHAGPMLVIDNAGSRLCLACHRK